MCNAMRCLRATALPGLYVVVAVCDPRAEVSRVRVWSRIRVAFMPSMGLAILGNI